MRVREPLYREIADLTRLHRPRARVPVVAELIVQEYRESLQQRHRLSVAADAYGRMQTLTVNLGDRSYPILIGPGLLRSRELLAAHVPARDVLLISNTVGRAAVRRAASGRRCRGDASSKWSCPTASSTRRWHRRAAYSTCMIANRARARRRGAGAGRRRDRRPGRLRRRLLPARHRLRAGADDAAGRTSTPRSAARPRSIIPGGKNMIGAFHQPRAVIADTDLLQSLPDARAARGTGRGHQVRPDLRRGVLRLARGQHRRTARRATPAALAHAIHRSCEIKARDRRRATSASRASARCSISATPSVTRSRRPPATASGCTARRSALGHARWPRSCRSGWAVSTPRSSARDCVRCCERAGPAGRGADDRRRARASTTCASTRRSRPAACGWCCCAASATRVVTADYPDAALQGTLAAQFGRASAGDMRAR